MKNVIVCLLAILNISFFVNTHAQAVSILFGNDKIKEWHLPFTEKEMKAEMKKVMKFEEFAEKLKKLEIEVETLLPHFYFIDFNIDGQKDLLFSGKIGSTDYVFIFRKKQNDYVLSLEEEGIILQANSYYEMNPLSFTIYKKSCCGRVVDKLIRYVTINRNEISYFQIQEKGLMYHTTSVHTLSRKDFSPKHFITKNTFSLLRERPMLKNKKNSSSTTENSIAHIPKNTEGVALIPYKGEDGITWYFVKMFSNPKDRTIRDEIFISNEVEDTNDYYYYGWIHEDNLKFTK